MILLQNQDYAKRIMVYGNFNTYRAGGTHLNVALTVQDWYAPCKRQRCTTTKNLVLMKQELKHPKHNKSW